MAVEIPVYINIQDAFNKAASEIPKEMPKLEKAISSAALKVNFGGDSLRRLLTDSSVDASQLNMALRSIRREFEAVVSGSKKARSGMNVDNLIKSYALLEQRITGTFNQSTVNIMKTEAAIGKVAQKITKLRAQLGKQTPGSDQFLKTNYELGLQQKRLAELNSQLIRYKAGIDSTSGSLEKQTSIVKRLTGYFGGLYAFHTVTRFVKQIRDVTGELEYQRVALGHLLKDVDYGNELFNKTVEAAKQSPFRITQLVTYTKQLAAYRIEQENLFDTTQRLADISAGLGVDMNRLILAYGQVRAASVLRGQELRQFTEAGIPLVDMLAEKFTELKGEMVSTADVFKLISERAVPFSMISEIFEDMTEKGGQFYKMQEQQAQTLKGRWEKLKDAYDQALMSIGENDTFQRWNDVVLNVLNSIAKNLRGIVKAVNALSISWVVYKVATSQAIVNTTKLTRELIKEFGIIKMLKFGVGELSAAFKKLGAALSSNWVGLALSAIAGLITYFTTFRKKTEEVASEFESLEKAIEKMSEANKAFTRAGTLITRYENLSKNTERTANENLKLSQTMNRLKEQFPQLSNVIGDENTALAEQIDLLTKANEARKEEARQEATKELQLREKEYEDALKNINKAQEDYNKKYQKFLDAQVALEAGPGPRVGPTGISGSSQKQLEQAYSDADKAAIAAKEHLNELNADAEKLLGKITRLQNQIDPSSARKDWAEWQNQIKATQDSLLEIGDSPVFTDIEGFSSIYDLSGKLKKKIDDLTTSIKGMKTQLSSMTDETSASYQALSKEISASEKTLEIAEAIRLSLGLVFGKGSSTSYTQDPFIKQMQDRIKFMKDFQKGYEDLSKYMSKAGALTKEATTMLTRGLSLGINASEQKRAAEDLSKWYEDTINSTFDYLRRQKGVTGTLEEFLSKQISDTSNRGKMLKDFQSLLQSLFDAKTDFDTSRLKKEFEDALKRVSDEIKRSETARNFYQNMLDLTGDEELSASMAVSVYGGIGDDFKDRIQKQLVDSLNALDPVALDGLDDAIKNAFQIGDYKFLMANLEKVPEGLRDIVKQVSSGAEKYNADWVADLIKTYQKAKTYEERMTDVHKREEQKRKEISESTTLTEGQKATYTAASQKKEAEEIAKIQLEALKDTYTWTKAFEDLDGVSTQTLKNLIKLIDDYIDIYGKDLEPQQLKELARQRENAKQQVASRDAYSATIEAIKKLVDAHTRSLAPQERVNKLQEKVNKLQEDGKEGTEEYKQALKDYKEATDELLPGLDEENEAIKRLSDAFREVESEINQVISSAKDLMSVFASDEDSSYFSEQMDNISKTIGGVAQTGIGIAKILTGTATPKDYINTFSGLADIVAGVFGAKNAANIRKQNKEIKRQQELIDDLEGSYKNLSDALDQAFGNERVYNFNQMLEVMAAEAEAYRKQAEAERNKGKKSDENAARGYEQSAADLEAKMKELRDQQNSFFAGQDITSAAEAFADAWLDAYAEFGDTSEAIEERMTEMIQNLVKKAALSGIAQSILGDWYSSLSDVTDWNAQTVAEKWREAMGLVQPMVDGMRTFANSLQSEGLSLRNTAGQFTGISRNIAGASEESINGLAAGINTQNFYMSYVPLIHENLAQILVLLTGGNTVPLPTESGIEGMPSVQQMIYDHLPNIDANINSLLQLFRGVVSPTTTNGAHYIYVKM